MIEGIEELPCGCRIDRNGLSTHICAYHREPPVPKRNPITDWITAALFLGAGAEYHRVLRQALVDEPIVHGQIRSFHVEFVRRALLRAFDRFAPPPAEWNAEVELTQPVRSATFTMRDPTRARAESAYGRAYNISQGLGQRFLKASPEDQERWKQLLHAIDELGEIARGTS